MKDKELVEIPLSDSEFNRITKNKTRFNYGMDKEYTKEKCECFMQSIREDIFNHLTITKKTYSPNSNGVLLTQVYGTCKVCDTEYRFRGYMDREEWEKDYKDKEEKEDWYVPEYDMDIYEVMGALPGMIEAYKRDGYPGKNPNRWYTHEDFKENKNRFIMFALKLLLEDYMKRVEDE